MRTYREGLAQKAGHDLIIEVRDWRGTAEVSQHATVSALGLEVDWRSLHVREGLRGVKPLTNKDREKIRQDIEATILRAQPISFRSTEVTGAHARLRAQGELTVAGATRLVEYELDLSPQGRLQGTLTVTQTDHGITPYRGFMGALKVRDTVDVVIDVQLPSDA